MKNFVQKGENITVTATAATASGDPVAYGKLFGIAANDAAIGDDLVIVTTGVFDVAKVSTDDFALGVSVYWVSANGLMTTTASSNLKIGIAVVAAGNPSATVNVRLNGSFV